MTEQSFETALERVRDLVADFQQHQAHYLSAKYQEQDVRKDFIDKFWIALGWDVNHERQKNPNEQEVKVERGVGVEGRVKKADYAFLTPNFRDVRFFVEAKKPARNIDNADDYFQTIRYGWNAQTPVSILTDFQQFHVLDCRLKPDVRTAPQRALRKFHYTDYADAERFAEIYYLFSREAAHAGALEKYAAALPKPSGRAVNRRLFGEAFKTVDEDFLQQLDELRAELASSFKNRNEELDGEALTEATQRTLDRLVFMRFLEDKLIEPEVLVERLGDSSGSAWRDFVAQSARLNGIYNGIIFKPHFIDAADFKVDEKMFASVRERLSHTNTVYNFNYIPIHVLGSIYERFLGKVIVTTDKRARVVEKPEVRKAGGVYYTPEYIVRYIVGETVGKLIAGRSPAEVSEMRFADIACGSGSFLLGVFDELLRHHTAYYNRNKTARAEGKRAGCVENADGTLRLSLRQKKAILTRNIYGVDLDAQAVEVAQLSLFLRLLEDETTASARGHQLEFRETMLPDLRTNIKHGNSLIGWDIGGDLFGDEEQRKLYPLDFEQSFPEVMRRGGFDAIVGNPPYSLVGSDRPQEQDYYRKKFSMTSYKTNTYVLFLEKGLQLLCSEEGLLGFIIPKSLVFNTFFSSVRTKLLRNYAIQQVIEIREKVFAAAEVGDSILFFARTDNHPTQNILSYYKVTNVFPTFDTLESHQTVQQELLTNPDAFFYANSLTIKVKTKSLSDLAMISNGLNPGNVRHILLADSPQTPEHRKMLLGRDIQKYISKWSGTWVNYNPELKNQIKISDIKSKKGMTPQTKVDFALRSPEIYKANKIMVRKTSDHIVAAYDEIGYHFDSLSYGIQIKGTVSESPLFLLGILNSNLMNFIHDSFSLNKEKVFAKVLAANLSKLPIRTINFSDKDDRDRHDRMVSLVEAMLDAKRRLQTARTDRDRDHYESKCAALDRHIDTLVYELYELTPAEIDIVEGRE